MNDRAHGHTSRLDRVVLAVIAANAVAVAGVVIDGDERLFRGGLTTGSSGACGTASLAALALRHLSWAKPGLSRI